MIDPTELQKLLDATKTPWRWQGEDYRGGWGWQMLVDADNGGILIGEDDGGELCPHLRAYVPVSADLCQTGLMAQGKETVACVHVLEPVAALIAHAPDLARAYIAACEMDGALQAAESALVDFMAIYGDRGATEVLVEVRAALATFRKAQEAAR